MSRFTRVWNVEIDEQRCSRCGRFWAIEAGVSGACPKCKHDYYSDLEDRLLKLRRANASLRGQLKRLKESRG